MILHENRLPADNSHEISWLIGYFWKSGKIWNCRLLQIIGGALRVNDDNRFGSCQWIAIWLLTGKIMYNIWQLQRAIQMTVHVLCWTEYNFKWSTLWFKNSVKKWKIYSMLQADTNMKTIHDFKNNRIDFFLKDLFLLKCHSTINM